MILSSPRGALQVPPFCENNSSIPERSGFPTSFEVGGFEAFVEVLFKG